MFMSSTVTPTNALAHAEEEIYQQIAFLSSLRARRNLLLPVFRLPPETLAIIFIHCARDSHERKRAGRFTNCIPTWVNVSYVCSHWRNIALNCSALWTYHFNVSPRWTEELLLRSKEASLKISCNCRVDKEVSWWPSLLNKLLEHSERIQELRLHVPSSFLPAKLSLCAFRLEKLDINFLPGLPRPSIVITYKHKLPLHTLKVEHCSLPWFSLDLSGLKILSLRRVDSPSPLNIVKFLTVLSSMQNLTVLDLKDVLPSARGFLSSGGLDVSPKIDLPCLTLLAVAAPLSAVIALLSCVDIPPRTQLNLNPLMEAGTSVDDFVPISSCIAQQFRQQSSGAIFRSLLLDLNYSPSLTFGLEPEPLSPSATVGCNVPLKIIIGDRYCDEIVLPVIEKHRIMTNIYCSLPLANIQKLHVTKPYRLSSEFWREILGWLDGLRYLKLSDGCMPDLSLLSLAAHKPENLDGQLIHDQDPTLGGILVPALEEMELERIMFTQGEGRMCQQSFFRTLSTRKGLQERVTMIECH